jgi:hypothetical protein
MNSFLPNISWVFAPCGCGLRCRHFGGKRCFHFQGRIEYFQNIDNTAAKVLTPQSASTMNHCESLKSVMKLLTYCDQFKNTTPPPQTKDIYRQCSLLVRVVFAQYCSEISKLMQSSIAVVIIWGTRNHLTGYIKLGKKLCCHKHRIIRARFRVSHRRPGSKDIRSGGVIYLSVLI